jgi:Protein of unknown function DUF262
MTVDSELRDEAEWRQDYATNPEEPGVLDEAETDGDADTSKGLSPLGYEITSYGADYPVDALVKRLDDGNIIVPPFQRGFVWSQTDASRFVESLLLGFPVPAIFLSKESRNKFLVVDGQQRLTTLQSFYSGIIREKKFRLVGVNEAFVDKTYEDLDEFFRNRLDNSIIHAIIVQQDQPKEKEDTSIYLLFERLNSWGRPLFPQEIRASVDHGPLILLLHELNAVEAWSQIYGKPSRRLKDEELILRFLALYCEPKYESPMKGFLNAFSRKNRAISDAKAAEFRAIFTSAIEALKNALGEKAFRLTRAFNAAVYDAAMVGVARRLQKGPIAEVEALQRAYLDLIQVPEFLSATATATAREDNVSRRIELATAAFASIP